MNNQKALKNIITSTIFKLIILIITILLRRYLLKYLGAEAVGLFSLFISIVGFLSIAELGVGTAITFSMYKPIVEEEHDKVSGLYFLYRRLYIIISVILIILGALLIPFIPYFAKSNKGVFNIKTSYVLYLIGIIITYLYGHKSSFINANQDNYITTIIRSTGLIVEGIIQIILIIIISKTSLNLAFNLFFMIIVVSNIFQWFITDLVFKKKYSKRINGNKLINTEDKKEVFSKTKAMFFHKIGGVLVNTTDSLIISAFISISVLGIYSNYVTIATGIIGILGLVFTSLISNIGHSYVKSSKKEFYDQFIFIYIINFILGFIFFIGFYMVIDDVIMIIFSMDVSQSMSKNVVLILTLNYFIQFMRQTVLSFRDASGAFYNDRYKPLIEGLINLVLSLLLVGKLGVSGVLIATIITNLTITHTVEPYVLFKNSLKQSPKNYYFYNYIIIFLFLISLIVLSFIPRNIFDSKYLNFLFYGFISVVYSGTVFIIIYIFKKDFRLKIKDSFKNLKKD